MDSLIAYHSILSTKAQKEITESWNWYEDRQQVLGDRFLNEVIGRIQAIEKSPNRFPSRYKSYR
jgi:hypothetical protein